MVISSADKSLKICRHKLIELNSKSLLCKEVSFSVLFIKTKRILCIALQTNLLNKITSIGRVKGFMNSRVNQALIFQGGGSLGAYEAGAYKAIKEELSQYNKKKK